jgi:hypothetical protein
MAAPVNLSILVVINFFPGDERILRRRISSLNDCERRVEARKSVYEL